MVVAITLTLDPPEITAAAGVGLPIESPVEDVLPLMR